MSKWVSERTVSEMSGMSIQTLRNWRHLRKGPPYSKVGRSVRYDLSDVEAYFQQRRIDPESDLLRTPREKPKAAVRQVCGNIVHSL